MDEIFGILVLIFIASIITPFLVFNAQKTGYFGDKTKAKFMWGLPILGFILLIGGLIASSGFVIVDPGTSGVIIRLGQVTDRVLDPGLHFKTPILENAVIYNTKKVIYESMNGESFSSSDADYKDYPVDTTTQDGQTIQVRYTIRFSIDPTKVKEIINNLGTESQLVEKVVKAESRVQVRNLIRKYAAEQLYTGDIDNAQMDIESVLEPVFAENGIILDSFGIRQIEFAPEYLSAIERKQIEKENVQTQKFIAEQEEFKKQAAITKAEGEARAQQLQRQTLSPGLLQKLWIEKWDGELPQYYLGAKNDTLLQIPSN